jgi:hypothetical protein
LNPKLTVRSGNPNLKALARLLAWLFMRFVTGQSLSLRAPHWQLKEKTSSLQVTVVVLVGPAASDSTRREFEFTGAHTGVTLALALCHSVAQCRSDSESPDQSNFKLKRVELTLWPTWPPGRRAGC